MLEYKQSEVAGKKEKVKIKWFRVAVWCASWYVLGKFIASPLRNLWKWIFKK